MQQPSQLHLAISGSVQGVFFRAEAAEKARQLGLTGWVRNTPDGGVEIVAQGPQEKLNQFIEWCKKGPDAAAVTHVEITRGDITETFIDFRIVS